MCLTQDILIALMFQYAIQMRQYVPKCKTELIRTNNNRENRLLFSTASVLAHLLDWYIKGFGFCDML